MHKTPESTATPTQGIKTFIWQQGTEETDSSVHWSTGEDLRSAWGEINTAVKLEVNLQNNKNCSPVFVQFTLVIFEKRNKPYIVSVLLKFLLCNLSHAELQPKVFACLCLICKESPKEMKNWSHQ